MAASDGSTSTAAPAADLASVLASMALSAQSSGALRDGAHVIFVDSARKRASVYGADCERLASNSVFFAGLFEPADGGKSDRPAAFAVCDAGRELSGMRRLPLPAPSAFQLLIPYLDSGDVSVLRALGGGARPHALSCNNACAVFSNACFLGVSEAAEDAIMTDILVPLWPRLADFDHLCPDLFSAGALEKLLRVLAERGLVNALGASRTVLLWAHRGGWGATQSRELVSMLDRVAPLSMLSSDDICKLAKVGVPRELLDIALPAEAMRARIAVLMEQLANANRGNNVAQAWCSTCARYVQNFQ